MKTLMCLRQKGHQRSNSTQLPGFGFDRIIHITEMLQVGRRIGLDHIVGVVEKFNDLVQVWVAPVNTRYAWKSRKHLGRKTQAPLQRVICPDPVFEKGPVTSNTKSKEVL